MNKIVPMTVAAIAALALGLLGSLPAVAASSTSATDPTPPVSSTRMSTLVGHDPSTADAAALSLVRKAGSGTAPATRSRVAAPSSQSTADVAPGVKAPTGPTRGIVITTPADPDTVYFVHGDWDVTIAGRAPAGAAITVTNDHGDVSESTVADSAGAWSVDLSFSHDGSWDQIILIDGTADGRALAEQLVEVQFDAPATQVPVITSPLPGDEVPGTSLPFGSGRFSVPVSGTAKPGDHIFVLAQPVDPADGSWDGDFADADSTGHFTVDVPVGLGDYSFTPVAQTIDDELGPLSGYTDGDRVGPATVVLPADYILPADVDPDIAVAVDDGTGAEPTFTVASAGGTGAADDPGQVGSQPVGPAAVEPTDDPTGGTGGGAVGDERYLATVTGTGTAGDGVQLFAADLSSYDHFVSGLYPGWFDESTAAPSEAVPAYDGRIVVGADGHWSATVSVPAGSFAVGAFAYDLSDPAAPRATVVGADQIFDAGDGGDGGTAVSGGGVVGAGSDPAVGTAELAFTGSNAAAKFLLSLGFVGVGAGLVVVARRRKRSRQA
ncbi:hypothetical protein EDF46_2767 [Frondihabitans sp. PhB188]|uniref:hypothetical protein n=1 Tax=Frondihabitans sp. PhB188 TaxID=2485200 RepID=UPI000F4AF5C9|nr:hypothetical protein [Frondihabitans sp. PhB188]ROQ37311.1 hypothetical protein EDF46_2767 [Frondihabitans sp. PhB188]